MLSKKGDGRGSNMPIADYVLWDPRTSTVHQISYGLSCPRRSRIYCSLRSPHQRVQRVAGMRRNKNPHTTLNTILQLLLHEEKHTTLFFELHIVSRGDRFHSAIFSASLFKDFTQGIESSSQADPSCKNPKRKKPKIWVWYENRRKNRWMTQ